MTRGALVLAGSCLWFSTLSLPASAGSNRAVNVEVRNSQNVTIHIDNGDHEVPLPAPTWSPELVQHVAQTIAKSNQQDALAAIRRELARLRDMEAKDREKRHSELSSQMLVALEEQKRSLEVRLQASLDDERAAIGRQLDDQTRLIVKITAEQAAALRKSVEELPSRVADEIQGRQAAADKAKAEKAKAREAAWTVTAGLGGSLGATLTSDDVTVIHHGVTLPLSFVLHRLLLLRIGVSANWASLEGGYRAPIGEEWLTKSTFDRFVGGVEAGCFFRIALPAVFAFHVGPVVQMWYVSYKSDSFDKRQPVIPFGARGELWARLIPKLGVFLGVTGLLSRSTNPTRRYTGSGATYEELRGWDKGMQMDVGATLYF